MLRCRRKGCGVRLQLGCCLAWEASPSPQLSPEPETSPVQSREKILVMCVSVCSGFSCCAVLWIVPHRAQKGFREETQQGEVQVKTRHQADTRASPTGQIWGYFPSKTFLWMGEIRTGVMIARQCVFKGRERALAPLIWQCRGTRLLYVPSEQDEISLAAPFM